MECHVSALITAGLQALSYLQRLCTVHQSEEYSVVATQVSQAFDTFASRFINTFPLISSLCSIKYPLLSLHLLRVFLGQKCGKCDPFHEQTFVFAAELY